MSAKNTIVTISLPSGSPRDVLVQMMGVSSTVGQALPVRAGSVRLVAGDVFGFEVCPGVSLSIHDVGRAQ